MKYFITLLICAVCSISLNAQPNISFDRGTPADAGTLDSSFGINGKVITEGKYDNGNAIALQKDGKLIEAGNGVFNGIEGYMLIRYNEDGSIDSSFGNEGRVITEFVVLGGLYAVAIQEDGKIVAAGRTNYVDIALVRYRADGRIDSSFGTNGIVNTDIRRYDY